MKGVTVFLILRTVVDRGLGHASLCIVMGHMSRWGWLGFCRLVYPLGTMTLYKGPHDALFFTCSHVHCSVASLAFFVVLVCVRTVGSLSRCCTWFIMTKRSRGAAKAAEEVSCSSELGRSEATGRFLATLIVEKRLPNMGVVRYPCSEMTSTPHDDEAFSIFF